MSNWQGFKCDMASGRTWVPGQTIKITDVFSYVYFETVRTFLHNVSQFNNFQ